ncbi:multicopper oxidase family protein [Oceanibaculum indicum]|uniref:Multicopper oxidase n=1 Tax=Oceanibaculum indicum P24 TaxID=1207063 RepID=K2J5G5_9PROT|nr:multicopper oxidase family protein [Oceanibaculum indicum]EKE78286.1 multicopper oxidase [Oceanibaculum indicum P24]
MHRLPPLSRRDVLIAGGALGAAAAFLPRPSLAATPAADGVRRFALKPMPATVPLVGNGHPDTSVWGYNGSVPGPEIRALQGETIEIAVENGLEQATTVHWHGIRLPNAMDGVPHVTQDPIAPGGRFTYRFALPDAGTYWYHPHLGSSEQLGRGLSGALIVEEREPVRVDREMVWLLDDWRLGRDAQIVGGFGDMHDRTHDGRIGNTVTLNGRLTEQLPVRAGERLRLRLVNVANARLFALEFQGHQPQVVALDGHPVTPHAPKDGQIVLGPGMRADIILDMQGRPGEQFQVVDRFYRQMHYRFVDLAYSDEAPLRDSPLNASIRLPANTVPAPDLANAVIHRVHFGGGMMSQMASARMDGRTVGLREMFQHGLAWTVNGEAVSGHLHDPLFRLKQGQSCRMVLENDTAWFHPIHLHGHAFRVIARNGQPVADDAFLDTVLLAPRETAEIAFLADNPGMWMLHCHVLEHQEGGMMGLFEVG